jgi:hypothetical protein
MEIKILTFVWLCLVVIGFVLMTLRNDVWQYWNEFNFVMTRGTIYHKITYVLLAILILPFSIIYSLQEIFNKKN